MNTGTTGRLAATAIAAITWIGLAVQFFVLYNENASILLTLWIVLAFFTILTNLLVAVVFTAIAANRTGLRADWVVAGTMLSILLVGVIYGLLLHGTVEISGGGALANVLLHMVTPLIVLLFWILIALKGRLTWRDPLLWAIYPLGYLGYAMWRGAATGKYAYPFLNVTTLGWERTVVNATCIAVAFMLCGYATVWIDRRLSQASATEVRT